ncbi:hypothetical protein [Microvirga lotononidis]|nr:hypothetical protein [Microvirga lotononidis]WQO27231.1 hypothetical protein U0023_21705 [Microvirga lotononidis]
MPHSRAMPAGQAAYPELCPDYIEQKIIRAYVQLAVGPDEGEASRTVRLGRFGAIEICLTEEYGAETRGLPPFWLEVRAQGTGGAIDRIGCHEFDEDEIAAAVAFVQQADRRLRVLH